MLNFSGDGSTPSPGQTRPANSLSCLGPFRTDAIAASRRSGLPAPASLWLGLLPLTRQHLHGLRLPAGLLPALAAAAIDELKAIIDLPPPHVSVFDVEMPWPVQREIFVLQYECLSQIVKRGP